ncbi:hypothetical protein JCM6882_007600 [Rhodosporidiobolus microsporus]
MLDSLYDSLTPLTLLTALATAAAILLALPFIASHLSHPRSLTSKHRPDLFEPKGSLPFIGHQLRVLKAMDRQPELWVEMTVEHRESGDKRYLSTTMLNGRFIMLQKPEDLEWIQRINFKNYVKGPRAREVMGQVLGEGIFTSDGHLWNIQRKATARVFTNTTYRGVISASISHTVDDLLTVLSHFASSPTVTGEPHEINLSKVFFSATLDTFCEMAFSTKPGALLGEREGKSVPFAAAFDSTQLVMARRFQQPFFPILEFFTGTRSAMRAATSTVHSYANDLIDKRQKELAARRATAGGEDEDGEEEGGDLLSMFLRIRDEDGKGLSRETLRDAVINLLIAGRDTTAGTLAWLTFHLLRQPHLIEGIRADAASLGIGPGGHGRKLEFDEMKEVDWTMACWYEAARLHPSVPVNFWTALDDDQIPGGPRIEKGDFLTWSDWTLHRDPLVWGTDAGAFKPHRWLAKDGEGKLRFRKESEYRMHAFNGGRRRCLGETLATFEALSVLLSLFSTFDLRFADDYLASTEMVKTDWDECESPRYGNALTLPMLKPLRVIATKRKADTA